MARLINGSLYVSEYVPTANPGEYTFENAIFNNQADSGSGVYALEENFLIFTLAVDTNTFFPVPGIAHRYRLSSITIVDFNTINGTMIWDEAGNEIDAPKNGDYAIVSEYSPNHGFGYPVDEVVYQLQTGFTTAVQNLEVKTVDTITIGSGVSFEQPFLDNEWIIEDGICYISFDHPLGTDSVQVSVLEDLGGGSFTLTSTDWIVTATKIKLLIDPVAIFTGKVIVKPS